MPEMHGTVSVSAPPLTSSAQLTSNTESATIIPADATPSPLMGSGVGSVELSASSAELYEVQLVSVSIACGGWETPTGGGAGGEVEVKEA